MESINRCEEIEAERSDFFEGRKRLRGPSCLVGRPVTQMNEYEREYCF